MSARERQAYIREKVEALCERGCEADRRSLVARFRKKLKDAGEDESAFFKRSCALCTYMNRSQDAIPQRELKMVLDLANEGIGSMDKDTHAYNVAFMWNFTIYIPMRKNKERILPFSQSMAYAHIYDRHRILYKPAERVGDIEKLNKLTDILYNNLITLNPMTEETVFHRHRWQAIHQAMQLKWKILESDDKKGSSKTNDQSASGNAGLLNNPLQAIRRSTNK
mgnify:CR=1 FL=1